MFNQEKKLDSGKVLISLCGKKQTGKSTSFRFIKEIMIDKTVERFSFADKLKKTTADLFGVDYDCLIGSDEQKDSPTYLEWNDVANHIQSDFYGPEVYTRPLRTNITHRELLQLVGTNLFRAVRPGIWPEYLKRSLFESNADILVVDDARFPNEVEMLRDIGGSLVKIYRNVHSPNSANHKSEIALDHLEDSYYDFVITDSGNRTMDDLKKSWANILGTIFRS